MDVAYGQFQAQTAFQYLYYDTFNLREIICCVSGFGKNLNVRSFSAIVYNEIFQTLNDDNLYGALHFFHTSFGDLDQVSGPRQHQKNENEHCFFFFPHTFLLLLF